MSLLAALGPGIQQVATNFIGKLFGANNSTPLQDCQRQVGLQGYAGTIAQYPHCAGILGAAPGAATTVAPVSPVAPVNSVGPGMTAYGNTTQASLSTMLKPLTGALPSVGTVSKTVRAATGAASALMKRYPLAAGVVGGFLVDAAGNFLADSLGRLVPARKRGRRINPLNHRALRRALRRVKAARHICSAIERELPKRHTRAPRSRSRSCSKSCH